MDDPKFMKYVEFVHSFNTTLLQFPEDKTWHLYPEHPPKEDGYYLTLRFTWGRLYTNLDQWKDGMFLVGIADGSKVIGYRELEKEDKKKLESYEQR